MSEAQYISSGGSGRIALAVILPILLVVGSIGVYFALKPKKCGDGVTPIPRNPFTGKRDLSMCPKGNGSDDNDNGGQEDSGGQTFGDSGVTTLGKCKFPLKNQSGNQGDEATQYCVKKVKQALAPEINEIGWFDEAVYGITIEKALDSFLEDEISSNDKPLADLKAPFGGCGNWLQGFSNCQLDNDKYKSLLEKRGVDVAWSDAYNQWR